MLTIDDHRRAITLHTGTARISRSPVARRPAFTALGFGTTMTAARTGGGTSGTGFVIGNDLTTFTSESDQRRRGHGLQCGGNAG